MAVDRDNGREIPHFEFPDRLGTPELFEADAEDTLDTLGVDLRGAADAVQLDATVFLAGLLGFGSHSAFPDDGPNPESLDDIGLIRSRT